MGNGASHLGKRHKTMVTDCSHQGNILMLLNLLRSTGQLIDFTVYAGDTTVQCHKVVLAAASSTGHLPRSSKEVRTQVDSVTLTDIDPRVLSKVINYIYTSNITIDDGNIRDVASIAKTFNLAALTNACEHFHIKQSNGKRARKLQLKRTPKQQQFCDVNNGAAILAKLNEMRKSEVLTDAEIRVQDRRFSCHRAVLASCSDYFRAMFTSDMHERNCHRITLNEISANIFEVLLDFIYTSQLVAAAEDMEDVLVTANYFQMHSDKLLETCTELLLSKLSPSNCLQVLNMSAAFLSSVLDKAAIQLAIQNFSKLYPTEQFLELSRHHLVRIISDDNLNINEEDTVLDAVLRWINHDASRKQHADSVMQCVRFLFIDRNYVDRVKSESRIMQSPVVSKYLDELGQPAPLSDKEDNTQRYKARDKLTNEVIVMLGGVSSRINTLSVESYEPSTGRWSALPSIRADLTPTTVVTLNNDIYVLGTISISGLSDISGQLWRYSSVANSWSQKASMKFKRWNYAACALSGKIYCIGGLRVGKYCLDEVEVYDPLTDEWQEGAPLLDSVGSPIAISYEERNRLFVFNGDPSVDTMQFFLPNLNQWYLLSKYHPPTNVGQFKAAFLVDLDVYILGSSEGADDPTMWILDLSTFVWKRCVTIPHTFNRNTEIVSANRLHDKLYVIMKEFVYDTDGVCVKDLMLDSYDLRSDRWSTLQALQVGSNKPCNKLVTFKRFKHSDKLYSDAYM